MASFTTNPSIDQAARLNFQDSFHALAQQTKSKLISTGVVRFLPSQGKTNNFARIGRIELVEVATRNPDKAIGDYAVDNRQFTKRRFTRTIQIDAKDDINELLKDPTSDILKQLNNAKERVIDRIAISAAVGSVLIGGPDVAPTSLSALNDGVVTVVATGGFVYATVRKITQNFINNDIQMNDFQGSIIAVTGSENSDLMDEDKFINNDFITSRPVEAGIMKNTGTYGIVLFAGSESGGIQVPNPILPEDLGAGERDCVVLARESIVMAMELGNMGVERSAVKVNSWDITIDFWINAMRTEGVLVQIVTTTI